MSDFANQIQQYLDNQMSADELSAFEALVATDPELQKELEIQQAARAAIFSVQQAAIKSQLQAGTPPKGKSWLWGLLVLLIAAGLILGFSFYRQTDGYLIDEPMASLCENIYSSFRGADMPLNRAPELESLCELYATEEYEALRTLLSQRLENLPPRDPLRMKFSYPLALAHAKLGDIQKAKELLLAIESNGYDYQAEAKKTLKGLNSFWR
ncbi:MAG: hypothetical protein AAFN10_25830 [Bacteroidota bacterium]